MRKQDPITYLVQLPAVAFPAADKDIAISFLRARFSRIRFRRVFHFHAWQSLLCYIFGKKRTLGSR